MQRVKLTPPFLDLSGASKFNNDVFGAAAPENERNCAETSCLKLLGPGNFKMMLSELQCQHMLRVQLETSFVNLPRPGNFKHDDSGLQRQQLQLMELKPSFQNLPGPGKFINDAFGAVMPASGTN
jgi:hypothetical protein